MAGAARRDPDRINELHELVKGPLQRMIRRDLQQIGVRPGADQMHDLVADGFVMILEVADKWRPDGGAHPCYWAGRRILAASRRSLGFFADELDAAAHEHIETISRDSPDSDVLEIAARLAASHPEVRLVLDALAGVKERDRRVFLRILQEQAGGNRLAAVTVAVEETMQPAAVRQVCRRVRVRIAKLVAAEPGYLPLRDLPLLAA